MVGFYLKRAGVLAFGLANTNDTTFIVCAGSTMRNSQAGNMSIYRKKAFILRNKLIRNGVVSTGLVFLRAYEFNNISEATSVILGQSRSGDGWINAAGQTYPQWSNPNKRKLTGPIFRKRSRFTNNTNQTFLVMDIVENRDDQNNRIYEYLLRPSGGSKRDEVLVPEHEVIRSLKKLIHAQIYDALEEKTTHKADSH